MLSLNLAVSFHDDQSYSYKILALPRSGFDQLFLCIKEKGKELPLDEN